MGYLRSQQPRSDSTPISNMTEVRRYHRARHPYLTNEQLNAMFSGYPSEQEWQDWYSKCHKGGVSEGTNASRAVQPSASGIAEAFKATASSSVPRGKEWFDD